MTNEEWLNKLLGDELIAHLQYEIAAKIVEGDESNECKKEFAQHAAEELEHFNKILDEMIKSELKVNSDLQTLISQCKSGYENMTEKDSKYLSEFHTKAEENAIKAYSEFIEELEKEEQPNTRLIATMREILKDEEEHKKDVSKIYNEIIKPKDNRLFDY